LLDSAEDICGAVQQVLSEHVSAPLPFDYLRSFVGFHLDHVFTDVLPQATREQLDDLIHLYKTTYLNPQRPPKARRPRAPCSIDSACCAISTTYRGLTVFLASPRRMFEAVYRGAWRKAGRLHLHWRFGNRHGSRTAGGSENMRRAVWLRQPGSAGAVGTGLLGFRIYENYFELGSSGGPAQYLSRDCTTRPGRLNVS